MRSRLIALATVGVVAAALFVPAAADAKTVKPSISKVSPAVGSTSGGAKITITGKNFAKGVKVKFGTAPAKSVRRISATKLTVVAPKHAAGTVDIRVVTKGGTSKASKVDKFQYQAPLKLGAISWSDVTDTPTGVTFQLPGKTASDVTPYTADNGVAAESRDYWGSASPYSEVDVTVDSAASGATGTFVPSDLVSAAQTLVQQIVSSGASHLVTSGLTTTAVDGYNAVVFYAQFTYKNVQTRALFMIVNSANAQVEVTADVWSPVITAAQLQQLATRAFQAVHVPN
jgi:hypothetical protein